MKQILILSIVCLSLCNCFQKDREKGRQLAMILLKDCKNKESGTDQDMDTLAAEEIPTTTAGQCMLACVYEKLDVVSFSSFVNLFFLVMLGFSSTRKETSSVKTSWNWPGLSSTTMKRR